MSCSLYSCWTIFMFTRNFRIFKTLIYFRWIILYILLLFSYARSLTFASLCWFLSFVILSPHSCHYHTTLSSISKLHSFLIYASYLDHIGCYWCCWDRLWNDACCCCPCYNAFWMSAKWLVECMRWRVRKRRNILQMGLLTSFYGWA